MFRPCSHIVTAMDVDLLQAFDFSHLLQRTLIPSCSPNKLLKGNIVPNEFFFPSSRNSEHILQNTPWAQS